MRIKNLTGSPYELLTASGARTMLPAFGTIDIDPHPMQADHYRQVGYFDISDTVTQEEDLRDMLRNEYLELSGKQANSRWGESRLQSEIDALLEQTNK